MGQKILVVEDNELNLRLFCDLLRVHGYEAEPVRDGREAVDRARAFAPDLIVMDIQMPYISGLELIEQLKADAALRATPIMAVTAYAAKGDEERIRDAGAEGYVSKPISVMRFVAAVAALLEAAAGRAAETGAAETRPEEPIAAEPGPDEPTAAEPEMAEAEPDPDPDPDPEGAEQEEAGSPAPGSEPADGMRADAAPPTAAEGSEEQQPPSTP